MVGGGPLLTITGCKGCLVVEDCGVFVLELSSLLLIGLIGDIFPMMRCCSNGLRILGLSVMLFRVPGCLESL